jgi:hypothetical protein
VGPDQFNDDRLYFLVQSVSRLKDRLRKLLETRARIFGARAFRSFFLLLDCRFFLGFFRRALRFDQVEGDVDNHVFLPANHTSPA